MVESGEKLNQPAFSIVPLVTTYAARGAVTIHVHGTANGSTARSLHFGVPWTRRVHTVPQGLGSSLPPPAASHPPASVPAPAQTLGEQALLDADLDTEGDARARGMHARPSFTTNLGNHFLAHAFDKSRCMLANSDKS